MVESPKKGFRAGKESNYLNIHDLILNRIPFLEEALKYKRIRKAFCSAGIGCPDDNNDVVRFLPDNIDKQDQSPEDVKNIFDEIQLMYTKGPRNTLNSIKSSLEDGLNLPLPESGIQFGGRIITDLQVIERIRAFEFRRNPKRNVLAEQSTTEVSASAPLNKIEVSPLPVLASEPCDPENLDPDMDDHLAKSIKYGHTPKKRRKKNPSGLLNLL